MMTLNFDPKSYVYFADLNRINIDDEQFGNVLNDEDKIRAEKFKRRSRRTQFVVARWLVRIALRDKFEIDFSHHYQLNNFRDWTILKTDQIFSVTISHSKNIVAIAVTTAKQNIGIDVEKHEARDYISLAKSFAHPNELQKLNQSVDKATDFYKLWTAKEALYKASALSFEEIAKTDLSAYINTQNVQIGVHYFHFCSLQNQQYSLSFCSGSCQKASIQEITEYTA